MSETAGPTERGWLPSDTALWHTCHIVHDVLANRVPEHTIDTLFPLDGDVYGLAAGALRVDQYYAIGDGSWQSDSTVVFGTGTLGLALMAGTMVASKAKENAARNQAAADATATWREFITGAVVYVTTAGFIIQTLEGLLQWEWEYVASAQVVSYNVLVLQVYTEQGTATWRLLSEWSELIFVLWALARHPRHPQLRDGSWLPPNWVEWAAAQGYRTHLGQAQITR